MTRFAILRKNRRWTQAETATRLRRYVTWARTRHVIDVELGRLTPTGELLDAFAQIFNFSPPHALLKPVIVEPEQPVEEEVAP
jgi:transcriptional regulator with XRE-family HTH domain